MRIMVKVAGAAAALALAAVPAWGAAPASTSNPGAAHRHHPAASDNANRGGSDASEPGPHATFPSKAKAYGRYCRGQSHKRSDAKPGTHGTPFSQCVRGAKKLKDDSSDAGDSSDS